MVSVTDLKIGAIVDIHDPYSAHDKHKYSIIIGISDDKFFIGTVFINSLVNAYAINSPALVALQYEIKQSRYQFLDHNSYVDCSQLTDRVQSSFMREINTSGRILGALAKDDLRNVIDLVLGAETILDYYKKLCNVQQLV
jgi:hypothetical protein